MSANDSLPVILVSAVDAAAASVLISEIIDDGGPSAQCNGVEPGEHELAGGAVWQLRNKYYTAAARLLPLADGAAPPAGLDVQAHVIYLTEDECSEAAAAAWSARAESARALLRREGVRLVAARAASEDAALAAWARARRYEPVALLAPAPPDDDDAAAETRGAARLREALHAHAWPGMRRARAPAAPVAPVARPHRDVESDGSAESSDESWGEWVGGEGGETGAVRRAELFADALALLPARHARAGADDAQRRLHAEQLVTAFCRALGHELRLDAPGDGDGDGGAQ